MYGDKFHPLRSHSVLVVKNITLDYKLQIQLYSSSVNNLKQPTEHPVNVGFSVCLFKAGDLPATLPKGERGERGGKSGSISSRGREMDK